MCLLNLVSEKYENEIKLLHSQIQSYNLRDPKKFLQNLPSPNHEEIVLPFDLQIEDNYAFKSKTEEVVLGFSIEDTTDKLDIEGLEETIILYAFVDTIADYMEVLLNSNSLTCFLYEDQIHQQWPLYITILIMWVHDQIMLLILLTISQAVHLFLQLLDWLHWHFCII